MIGQDLNVQSWIMICGDIIVYAQLIVIENNMKLKEILR